VAPKIYQFIWPDLVEFKCPVCGGAIPNFDVKFGFGEHIEFPERTNRSWKAEPFQCPSCRQYLCVSDLYARGVLIGALALAAAIVSLLSIHPFFWRIPIFIAIWLAIGMLASAYVKILVPPKLRVYVPSAAESGPHDDFPSLNIRR
jgi:hypothetical protein